MYATLRIRCSHGKQNACIELAKLAENGKDSSVRTEAAYVYQLNDQILLAKIALGDEDEKVRSAAFGRLTDPKQLEKVAQEAEDENIARLRSRGSWRVRHCMARTRASVPPQSRN